MGCLLMDDKQWIDETWTKIDKKLKKILTKAKHTIPYKVENGKYIDASASHEITNWVNGFWPGMMWLMYDATGNAEYRESAEYGENALDIAMDKFDELHHDVGFMWLLSSVANYRLTGNEKSRNRGLHAASVLATRYNPNGQYIGAWPGETECNWVIIDCMMNISLLYWASEQTKNPSYKNIAMHHADTCMKTHIRADGSVNHVVAFDGDTGENLGKPHTQGYDVDSSWSRGQSWAIYGYALSALHTGEERYLDVAKKVAHYFIASICDNDYVPKVDFRQPDNQIDTSAGAIAACGLIEISKAVPERESKTYLNAAVKIMKALSEKHCDWTDEKDNILENCSAFWSSGVQIPAMYGEYFYIEAMYKLKGFDKQFW